jgi:hypothetical protein
MNIPNLFRGLYAVGTAIGRKFRYGADVSPIPLYDRGHRCFLTPDESGVKALGSIFAEHGLHERMTFDAGKTIQTLFDDDTTVIMQITDKGIRERIDAVMKIYTQTSADMIGPCAVSLVTRNPEQSAKNACQILSEAGFTARLNTTFMAELGDKFAIVESDACLGWSLCFRRHAIGMGKPKNMRKLT